MKIVLNKFCVFVLPSRNEISNIFYQHYLQEICIDHVCFVHPDTHQTMEWEGKNPNHTCTLKYFGVTYHTPPPLPIKSYFSSKILRCSGIFFSATTLFYEFLDFTVTPPTVIFLYWHAYSTLRLWKIMNMAKNMHIEIKWYLFSSNFK